MSALIASRPAWDRFGWLLGIPVLSLLWAGAVSVVGPHLSDSVAEQGAAIARDTRETGREPWLRVENTGRDLVALGEAPNVELRAAALKRLLAIPGLRRLDDRTGQIELASPFVLSATRKDDELIEITGSRPAETGTATFQQTLSAALPAHLRLRDRSRAAYGAPAEFLKVAEFAVANLRDYKPGAVATVSNTMLSFEGESLGPASDERLRTALAAVPAGFSLAKTAAPPPAVDEFRFAIERRPDSGFYLSGHAASDAAKAEVLALLRQAAPGTAIQDGLQTARGLPAAIDSSALARVAVRLSMLLRSGSVGFDRTTLSVSGTALDAQAAAEIETMMGNDRPSGVSPGPVSVTVQPPSSYQVRIRREGSVVQLSGYLPNEATRETLRTALRTRFFDEAISDRTRLAEGAPENLAGALVAGIGSLSTLARGELVVSDSSLRLDGESLYPASAEALAVTLPRSMPRGWSAAVSVKPRAALERHDAATCARLLSERIGARRLHFAPGSSALKPDFYPVLDAVAALMKRCPQQRIEVAGHTDPPGTLAVPFPDLPNATNEKSTSPVAKTAAKLEAGPSTPKSRAGNDKKPEPKPELTASAAPVATAAAPAGEPEPNLNLLQMRAQAIVDYLQKAGVPPEQVLTASAAPESDHHGVGLALRS